MTNAPQQLGLAPDVLARRHADALAGLTKGEVRTSRHDRLLYATDASLYQVEPLGVVIPDSVGEIQAIVAYCAEHGLPILARGGGTSLAGQCVNRAVVIDTSARCTALLAADPSARTCTVEPGITIDDLNDQLGARADGTEKLFFAPDPATARHCNIGGAIGNNAAGTRSILYGRTAESLVGVDVVLATGEGAHFGPEPPRTETERRLARGVVDITIRHEQLVRDRFPKTLRRNAGYALDMVLADIDRAREAGDDPVDRVNLAHLICGSEGTLAVTTGATLRLHPRPRAKGLGVLGFSSLDEAIDAVGHCLTLGPSAVELLDDLVIGLARTNTEYRRYAELMPQPTSGPLAAVLYVEFFSATGPEEIDGTLARLGELIGRVSPNAVCAPLTNPDEILQALKLRKAGEPLLHALPGARKPIGFVEDNAVPVEHLSRFVREFRDILARNDTRGAFYAHASVGVLHVRPLLDPRDRADRERMERIAVEVADLAKSLGGVMSGEHGDGRARGPLLERFYGPELMDAFREVKALFDPNGLLNPGNIVGPGPIESIHETLRVRPRGENLRHADVETYFDYSDEEGFDHAVELCNGSGVCRKKEGFGGVGRGSGGAGGVGGGGGVGTMCPSYRATLDERHSTRGRANALRLAITGQFTDENRGERGGWNDPETLETLDLCLSCKACKTECPSNVDVARYKAEYLAQSYAVAGGPPFAARLIADVRRLNRLGSAFAPLSNWVANFSPIRAINNRVLGLAPRRSLPRFERSAFKRSRDLGSVLPPDAPSVVLFADCFTTYNEPGIALAAIRTLNAFGYRVHLPDCGCCARPAISTGLLDSARATVMQTVARLGAAVERHNPKAILFLEPSCLSAITDDWQKLTLDASRDARAQIASLSFLAEDFLDRRWDDHPVRPTFTTPKGRIVLHAHCHQKALWGADTSARIFERVFGSGGIDVLDSGCCGMAGAFGMSAHRYGLSQEIGELSLFPAARSLGSEDVVLAPGTSCRHQLRDGANRVSRHPIEILSDQLSTHTTL